jgi:hypothetical protein
VPGWTDLYQLYAAKLSGLVLSFIIAGVFWFSHHSRLARQPYGSRNVVILNLLFLLSIVLLPVTNALYSDYSRSSAVAVIYGLHLTVIAMLNAGLWWLVSRDDREHHPAFIGAVVPVVVFLPGTLVALFAPQYALYLWFLAFGGLFVRRFFQTSRTDANEVAGSRTQRSRTPL